VRRSLTLRYRWFLRTKVFKMELLEDYMSKSDKYVPEKVDEIDVKDLDKKMFTKDYLFASKPLLMKNMAKEWPAFTKWQNETYLREMSGDDPIQCETTPLGKEEFAYFHKDAGSWSKLNFTYGEFLTTIRDPQRKFNIYFAEEDVPGNLHEDITEPWLAKDLLVFAEKAYWHGIGTVTPPHTDGQENFMCVM